ncbi:MAG: acetylornithine deacetylase/succinyl-diaminopimelate desuccinylase-like protein, partial [Neolewinella sp.]
MTTQQYIDANRERYLEELFRMLRIPSVSTDKKRDDDTHACAVLLQTYMAKAGLENVTLYPTDGHPIVYADKMIDPALPTILVYGHYDVQPAAPLDEWNSDPFEPEIRKTEHHPDGAIFARGSTDDKGQMFIHVKAVEAMIQTDTLPCNVKFMIEGEEEVGSPNLDPFIRKYKDLLAADVILVSDTSLLGKENPSITVGLRGLTYLDVKITSARAD